MRERGERRISFRVLGVIFFLGAIGWFLFFAYSAVSKRVTFPDGSTLELAGVTLGTNAFLQGNPLEKILGNRISPKGFSFAGLKFERPQPFSSPRDAPMTVWLRLKITGSGLDRPDFGYGYLWDSSRVIAANGSGRQLENFAGTPLPISSNQMLIAVPLNAFPRNERTVQLKILPKENHGKAVAFEFANPLRVRSQKKWQASKLPSTNEVAGAQVVLRGARAEPPEFQFEVPGKGWFLTGCRIEDEEGNGWSWSMMQAPAGRRFRMGFPFSLEKDRVWRVNTKWVRAAHLPMSEASIFPEDPRIEVKLTSSGAGVNLTNAIGEMFVCRLNWARTGAVLAIKRVEGRERPYWALLEGRDEAGNAIAFEGGAASERGPKQIQEWQANVDVTNLTVRLVCAKTMTTEFYWMSNGSLQEGPPSRR